MLLLTYTHMMNRSIESTESQVSLFCVYAIFFFYKNHNYLYFKPVHFNKASILLSFEPELNDQTTCIFNDKHVYRFHSN